jgi:hypothetical protein
MKAVLWLVAIATVLVFIGGFGFIFARIADADRLCVVFQGTMVAGAGVTLLALTIALVVGFYHLYLYWFTDKKPLSLFATTKRDE